MRDNLASRAATTASDTFRKYFTDTYDQFYTQAEATVTTFSDQDKFEQQFLDANGRILLSTSGLSGGGRCFDRGCHRRRFPRQKTAVFTGTRPAFRRARDERHSAAAELRAAIWSAACGIITSLRMVERQIWIIVGFSLLACLLFLMLRCGVEQLFYPVDRRSGAQDQHHRQGDRGRTLRRAPAEDL